MMIFQIALSFFFSIFIFFSFLPVQTFILDFKYGLNADHYLTNIFMRLVKSRVKTKFDFYVVRGDLDVFVDVRCQEQAIFALENDKCIFSTLLFEFSLAGFTT